MEKPVITFILGAALASGVAYVATRNNNPAPPAQTQPAATTTATTPAPAVTPEPAPVAEPPKPSPVEVQPAPTPVHTAKVTRRESATKVTRTQTPPRSVSQQPTQTASNLPPAAPAPAANPPAEPARPTRPGPGDPGYIPRVEDAPIPPPAPPKPNTVTIPAGTSLHVRLGQAVSTEYSQPGDNFTATLDQALVVNGFVLAERGARVDGRVVQADKGGRVQGLAELKIELTRLNTSDGQRVGIRTDAYAKQAEASKKEDAAKIGGGAALGAIIGAIAGGGKGAAIGAATGGAAGGGVVMATRGKQVTLPVESRMAFRLREPVTLTEKLR